MTSPATATATAPGQQLAPVPAPETGINTIIPMIPLFSALFIFLAIFKLYVFYIPYSLNIIPYLTLNDLLISFAGDIAILTSAFLVGGIGGLFIIPIFGHLSGTSKWKYLFRRIIFLVGLCGLFYLFSKKFMINLLFLFLLISFLGFILIFKRVDKFLGNLLTNFKFKPEYQKYFLYVTVIYMIFQVVNTSTTYLNYRGQLMYRNATIILKNKEVIPRNSQEFYIGCTEKYYFTYNFIKDECRVIKAEDVDKVTFYRYWKDINWWNELTQ